MKVNEKLAILTALKKMVETERKTARKEADAELISAYNESGVKQMALKVGGIEVGTFSITFNSGEWEITDKAAFDDFALAYGFATIERGIKPEYMHRAIELLAEDEPDGITETVRVDPKWIDYITNDAGKPMFLDSGMEVPGVTYTGKTVKGTQVCKCEPETVAPILRQMGGVDALLLEDGE